VSRILVITAVFLLAVLLRLSSCYESFWIDELHTAWTIAGDFGDVAGRASSGNQMPVYFWGLWLWQQAFGDAEVVLRLTSVLAVAASAAYLSVVVTRQTSSTAAGLTSGLVLAVERNALFFGTELRPYAAVMLVATIALGETLRLLDRRASNSSWHSVTLTACLIAGVLLQPTSLGVLLWMPVVLIGASMLRRRSWWPQFGLGSIVQAVTFAAAVLWAWRFTLQSSWQAKENWSTFAVPTWIGPYWEAWPWWTLAIGPLILAGWLAEQAGTLDRRPFRLAVGLNVLAFGITFFYWSVSYSDWVPLWHRRYFVGTLPILAAAAGASIASFEQAILAKTTSTRRRRVATILTGGAGLVLLAVLVGRQGNWSRVADLPRPLIVRGEDWRRAVEWLSEQRGEGESVHVDAGLIEYPSFVSGEQAATEQQHDLQIEYLTLPLRGPYRLAGDGDPQTLQVPINRDLLFSLSLLGSPDQTSDRIWIISRRNARQMKAALRKSIRRSGPFDYDAVRVTGFGNVSVAEVPRLQKPKRRWLFGF